MQKNAAHSNINVAQIAPSVLEMFRTIRSTNLLTYLLTYSQQHICRK